MTQQQAAGIVNAVLEAVVVAHLDAFDDVLEGADVAPDLRAALRAEEYRSIVAWYRDQVAAFDRWLVAFDAPTIH